MIYDCKCDECGRLHEIVRKMDERDKDLPTCCGQVTRRVISRQYAHSDFEPYLDENLADKNGNPRWIKSKQHRKEVLTREGLSEAYGKGWI